MPHLVRLTPGAGSLKLKAGDPRHTDDQTGLPKLDCLYFSLQSVDKEFLEHYDIKNVVRAPIALPKSVFPPYIFSVDSKVSGQCTDEDQRHATTAMLPSSSDLLLLVLHAFDILLRYLLVIVYYPLENIVAQVALQSDLLPASRRLGNAAARSELFP